jgi:hypothetical protein
MVFIFDLGTQETEVLIHYYFDEIQPGVPPVVTGATLPLDFETGTLLLILMEVQLNANKQTGINTTATVAKMVKGAGHNEQEVN